MFFLPDNPNYRLYEDISFIFISIFIWVLTVFFILNQRTAVWDIGRISLVISFVLKAFTYSLSSPTIGHHFSVLLASSNSSHLVLNLTGGIGWCAAVAITISSWQESPDKLKKSIAVWLSVSTAIIILLIILWFSSPIPNTNTALSASIESNNSLYAFILIHDLALVFGLIKIRLLCLRNVYRCRITWLNIGFKLVLLGLSIYLFYACVRIFCIVLQFFNIKVPYWHAITVPSIIVAAGLTFIGFTIPTLGPSLSKKIQTLSDHRTLREITPLWKRLVIDNPNIALHDRSNVDSRYQIYRRAVEIRDGLTRLAPFITPYQDNTNIDKDGYGAAHQIHQALLRKNTNTLSDECVGFAPLEGDTCNFDLNSEILWLRQVAKSYARLERSFTHKKPNTRNEQL